jgi:hypothetical protein
VNRLFGAAPSAQTLCWTPGNLLLQNSVCSHSQVRTEIPDQSSWAVPQTGWGGRLGMMVTEVEFSFYLLTSPRTDRGYGVFRDTSATLHVRRQ